MKRDVEGTIIGQPVIEAPTIIQAALTSAGKAAKLHDLTMRIVEGYMIWSASRPWEAHDKSIFGKTKSLSYKVPENLKIQSEALFAVEDHLPHYRRAARAEIQSDEPLDILYFKRHGWSFTEGRHVSRDRDVLRAQGTTEERIKYLNKIRDQFPWNPAHHGLDSKEATTAYAGGQEYRTGDNYATIQDQYDVVYRTTEKGIVVPRGYTPQTIDANGIIHDPKEVDNMIQEGIIIPGDPTRHRIGADRAYEDVKIDEYGHNNVFTQITKANLFFFESRMIGILRDVYGDNRFHMPVVFRLPRELQVHYMRAFKGIPEFSPEHELETTVKPFLTELGVQQAFPEYFDQKAA